MVSHVTVANGQSPFGTSEAPLFLQLFPKVRLRGGFVFMPLCIHIARLLCVMLPWELRQDAVELVH
ncbi:hypothetical protein M514_06312 [Trichuris suis]|uniref:Uncharacterized protein n=1 Tax=Trichuris suis TaxID=68888 RepID=A0A085N639_9BILA|nr:hypothetical protein M514_06312 [Trichuris suis]